MNEIKTVGSLFAGVGGFDLGAARAGLKSLWAVENNKFRQTILKQHFPSIKIYGNIETTKNIETVDVITCGFPCPDISVAGNGIGIFGNRSGLWSEAHRLIFETKPRYVIIENSPQLRKKGLDVVLYDLARIGYDAEWKTLSCEQFGHRHLRKRLFVVAYTMQKRQSQSNGIFASLHQIFQQAQTTEQIHFPMLLERFDRHTDKQLFRANDGFSNGLDKDRIEAMGDTVSPVITEYLFRCIQLFEQNNSLSKL
jgi:DNA (cytosine-5)-methyltransferase 1